MNLLFSIFTFCSTILLVFSGVNSYSRELNLSNPQGKKISSSSKVYRELSRAYELVTQLVPDKDQGDILDVIFTNIGEYQAIVPLHQSFPENRHIISISKEHLNNPEQAAVAFVHELAHILRFQRQPREEIWLVEALAILFELYFTDSKGLLDKYLERFHSQSEISLNQGLNGLSHGSKEYPTSGFLGLYFYNRFGGQQFIQEVFESTESGWSAIETTLATLADEKIISIPEKMLSRESLWTNFGLAVLFNDNRAAHGLSLLDDSNYTPLIEADYAKLLKSFSNSVQFRYDRPFLHYHLISTEKDKKLVCEEVIHSKAIDARTERRSIYAIDSNSMGLRYELVKTATFQNCVKSITDGTVVMEAKVPE